MSKVAICNMLVGFIVLFLAMCAGAFVATAADEAFLQQKELLFSWAYVLQKSAHGHLSLFGYLHILFGLSIPYSRHSQQVKVWQSGGIFLGTFAMSILMILRSWQGVPSAEGIDYLGALIGICLVAAMLSVLVHIHGLWCRIRS